MKKWILFFLPVFISLAVVGFFYNTFGYGAWVQNHGVIPRTIDGLWGILLMVFAHGNTAHLWSNVPSLLLLLYLCFFYFPRIYVRVLVFTWIGTGTAIWLFCRGGVMHVGASGLIYALFAFLFVSGILAKNRRLRTVTMLTGITFSGMFWGVLPIQNGVSWDGHLSGMLVGVLAAFIFKRSIENYYPVELKDWQKEHDVQFGQEYNEFDYRNTPM